MTRMYGLHTLRDLVVVRTLNRLAAAHAAARRGLGTAPVERACSHCRPLRVLRETIELDNLATTVTTM